jgi:hypothetical protein
MLTVTTVQVPAPPPPPEPILVQTVGGSGPPEQFFIAITLISIAVVTGMVLYPLFKAFAKRLEGKGGGGDAAMLESRVIELEHRLAEAEERIDFNERMLAQREAMVLPREKAD